MGFSLYPSAEQVFDRMVPSFLIGVLYSAMVESFVSEQFSRMTAMEASMKNADEMLAKLELELNHARQSMITQEIPVGIITAAFGGPFFLYLLWKSRRGGAAG